jgi:uncharacterized membrane protein YbhN (UPF0104 family)
LNSRPLGPDTDEIAGTGRDQRTPPRGGRFRVPWNWIGGVAVLAVASGFLILRRGEWPEMAEAAREASAGFLLLGAALQMLWLTIFGVTFWAGLRAVEVRLPLGRSLMVAWACNFINMVVKSGGTGGMVLFLRAAGRRGYTGSRTTLGYLLALAVGYAAFVVVLAVALVLLWAQGDARRSELLASGVMVAVIFALMGGVVLVVRSPERVRGAYGRIAALLNGAAGLVGQGPLLDAAGGDRAAEESAAVVRLVRERPARVLPVLLAHLGKELCGVAVLYTVLRAFDASASPALAVIAYALTILFSYVSVIPSGLGLVEVSLTALLIRSGIPAAPAALTTIVYRFFEFWTPFLVGAVATRFRRGL